MALSKAITRTRLVNCPEDYQFIIELSRQERLSFDPSGEPTHLESLQFLKNQLCIIGLVSFEMSGYLIMGAAPNPALPDKRDTIVIGCAVVAEFRGSRLFKWFNDIAVKMHEASGNHELVSYCLTDNPMLETVKRWGWVETRKELRYKPQAALAGQESRLQIETKEFESPAACQTIELLGL